MNELVYAPTLAGLSFIAFLALKYFDKRLTYAFGLLFALYVGLDDMATGLPTELRALRFVGGHWNWTGKILSLMLAAAVILGLRMHRRSVGLMLPERNIRACTLALIPLSLMGVVLGWMFNSDPPSAETLAFQALMPAGAEELALRGVAPALLLGLLYGKEPPPAKTPWAVVFIAAVPFGLVHGLGYSARSGFSFDIGQALYTYSGGLVYGWLRFASGSLLFPFLAHSFANVLFQLVPLVK